MLRQLSKYTSLLKRIWRKKSQNVTNKSSKIFVNFKYLGMRPRNQSRMQEKLKSKLNSGKIFILVGSKYFVSVSSENMKIKIYGNATLPGIL